MFSPFSAHNGRMHPTGRRILLALVASAALLPLVAPHAASAGPVDLAPAAPHRVGTISIPKLRIRQPILSGVTDSVFDLGVGYWPGTALPGQAGNMVLGGHRTAGTRPFYDIQKLRTGDPIMVTRGGRTYTYRVTGSRIVKPTATWILNPTPHSTLTLFSCHPRGSVRQRYVVTASLQP